MRLDLADLRLFIAIVDTGSITGGAANAHLATASASERLRKMEAEIGVPLLHRHARGVTMTEAGEVLARHARPLLAQQQRLRQAMHAFACGQRGRCACSPTPRRCRPFCRGSSPHGWQRTRRCRSKPKNAPARISSAVSWRACRQLTLWPKKRKWRLRRCSTSRWSPSIRPVRYSSISNSTQLNSARR